MDFSTADDAAMRALFWPIQNGVLALPSSPVVFMGAREGGWLRALSTIQWQLEQPFLPFANALSQYGLMVSAEVTDTGFAAALLLPSRQREERRAQLARLVQMSADGGLILTAASNDEGAKSLESDVRALLGAASSDSKFKSRVIWGRVNAETLNQALLTDWLALAESRLIGEGEAAFYSRPGLFAWDRVDQGSRLLVEHLPTNLTGRVADLGAGWGYLSMHVGKQCAGVSALHLFEANAHAVAAAKKNLEAISPASAFPAWQVDWHDVTTGLPATFDVVISNPPFHVSREDLPELGRAFIRAAADALVSHGQMWLVANRHLPYEDLLRERFHEVVTCVQRDGYKVIHAQGVIA